jgi:serine/threonine protein phosphatase PrpC
MAFVECDKEMFAGKGKITHEIIHLSGSTCATFMIHGSTIYSSNAGDSRAILVGFDNTGHIKVRSLTEDHKPDNPIEKK